MDIIKKVRIVTFRGTPEQISRQEGLSRPFGILNSLDKIGDTPNFCEVKVEDASSVDLNGKKPLVFLYKGEEFRVIPFQARYEDDWVLRCYDLNKGEVVDFKMWEIIGGV